MNRRDALIAQGARCGHIDGRARNGAYVIGEEYTVYYDAALNALPAGSHEDDVADFASGHAAGYRIGADGRELDDDAVNAPLPEDAMTILKGHYSADTAYVVEDYPYGFRLRCRIRYWLERTKHGVRMVSQTTNPKAVIERWNKPKPSTYHDVAVMYLDDEQHVQQAVLSHYDGEERIAAYVAEYRDALTQEDHQAIDRLRLLARAGSKLEWQVTPQRPTDPKAHAEEQKAIWRRAVALAAGELKKEGQGGDK